MPEYERKHDYLKELWHNRPWRYIPAVIGHMQRYPWSVVKRKPGSTFKHWLGRILYLHWQPVYMHTEQAVYERCAKCMCFNCNDKKCRKKNCELCDRLSRCYGEYGMLTTACAHAPRTAYKTADKEAKV